MRPSASVLSKIGTALCAVTALMNLRGLAQTVKTDAALLAETRSRYDAPFTRDLGAFDCALQFDWKKHFVDVIGRVPPDAEPTLARLQGLQHRVFVDRSGAVVSILPKTPDLSDVPHGTELEQALNTMVSGGLNAWGPFGANVILPVGGTKFAFARSESGYSLMMNGPGVDAQIQLTSDLRVTSVVSKLPQPLHFVTDFQPGPDGLLLRSVSTGNTADAGDPIDATFEFTYQEVGGFQLPSSVTVRPASSEIWSYALTGCKVSKSMTVTVGPPR